MLILDLCLRLAVLKHPGHRHRDLDQDDLSQRCSELLVLLCMCCSFFLYVLMLCIVVLPMVTCLDSASNCNKEFILQ